MAIESISAITFGTRDMAAAVAFFEALGFVPLYGGPTASFTSFRAGSGFVNLVAAAPGERWDWWGRAIFHVDDVDATYRAALAAGYSPDMAPSDATWGERYFHITSPDGHEISIARSLSAPQPST